MTSNFTNKNNNVSFEDLGIHYNHIHITTMFSSSWWSYIELIMMLPINAITSVLKVMTIFTYRLCLALSWGNYIELIMMLQINAIMSVLKISTYIITSTCITYRLRLAVVISAVLKVSTYIINSITYRLCFSISWRSLTSQITIRQWVPVKLSLSRDYLSTPDCELNVNL